MQPNEVTIKAKRCRRFDGVEVIAVWVHLDGEEVSRWVCETEAKAAEVIGLAVESAGQCLLRRAEPHPRPEALGFQSG